MMMTVVVVVVKGKGRDYWKAGVFQRDNVQEAETPGHITLSPLKLQVELK